jgi:hypothetical protein
MVRLPIRLLIIIMLCPLIDSMRYDINRTLLVYANQTPQLPGVEITSHVQGQHVPAGILSIMGVSTDNSTGVCEVYIILNEIRPYQRVYPNGSDLTGNDDYSIWSYTFTPEYATIQEGNNRMVSKITCIDQSGINDDNLTKFNSLNVTGMKITGDAISSDLSFSSTNSTASSSLPTNTTYADSFPVQDRGSIITSPDNALSNHSQNADTQDDEQIEENDNSKKGDGVDYSSSRDEDDENEGDFSIEELHDRVLDQVTEQLRESGIDFPP